VEGIVLLRRGENPSLVLEAVHAKVEELNSRILPQGMKSSRSWIGPNWCTIPAYRLR